MKRLSNGTTTSGEVRELALKIQERTGVDLIKESRLAQLFMDIVWDIRGQNLFGILQDTADKGILKGVGKTASKLLISKEKVARANTAKFLSNADTNIFKKTQAILKAAKNPVPSEVLWILRLKDLNVKKIENIYEKLSSGGKLTAAQTNFLRNMIQKNKQHEGLYNTAPIGRWEHWPIYKWPKWSDAEKLLLMKREWEVQGAYTYKWESVDLVWGNEHGGFMKIINKHSEILWKIQKYLDELPVKAEGEWKIILENNKARIVISKNYKWKQKRWILTAFEFK